MNFASPHKHDKNLCRPSLLYRYIKAQADWRGDCGPIVVEIISWATSGYVVQCKSTWPHHLIHKTFKVRGTSIVIIITSYWYYNLILLPKLPDDFATDVLLMIDWSIADQWLIKFQWMPPSCYYRIREVTVTNY